MSARQSVPSMRPRDVVFRGPEEPEETPEDVKTTLYLTRQLMDDLEDRRTRLRKAGQRGMSASRLIRAALRIAAADSDEWDRVAQEVDS